MKRTTFQRAILLGISMACIQAACGWSQTGTQASPTQQRTAKTAPSNGRDFNWNAPLPSAAELKQRVMANLKKSQAEQERYVCKTTNKVVGTDKKGNVKYQDVKQYDMFFVNGQEIDELTGKNGKPLTEEKKKKEAERVQKEIKKDSDEKYVAKQDAENARQIDMLLHMLRYTNGHRVNLNGRPTLDYDLTGDPNVHPKGVQETFLHDMTGAIQVDELTGQLVDLNARLDHDVKVGGGVLANLHKGFWMHVRQQRYPDGVWLLEKFESTGDARAALFFHPYFRFSQTMSGCALTNVSTSEGPTTLAK
ncbi:MAG: hypothetical protein ACYDC6_11760 [Acidobacteriaceae bacterium]